MVSVFDAQRVFCLSCVLLDVICMDRDWIINVPKPTLSPYCNLCKSHHLSDEFSKRGTSPVPNSSVAQSVISMTKIAMLIWQPDFDLQRCTEAHVLWLPSLVFTHVLLHRSSNAEWIEHAFASAHLKSLQTSEVSSKPLNCDDLCLCSYHRRNQHIQPCNSHAKWWNDLS